MVKIDSGRITNPANLHSAEIVDAVTKSKLRLVVQFDHPKAYGPAILDALNEACRIAGDRIQVRFYGHYGATFDASVLRRLQDVRDFAADCLFEITNEDEIGRLPKLTRLSFGVFELNRPAFLETIDLAQLTRLVLSENRKRNVDLSPLARSELLDELFINGHSKGIGVLAGLSRLRKLSLGGYAKAHSLSFVSGIRNLKELTLILGGRTDIDDLSSESIETLQVLRVRGVSTLGDLSRLSAIQNLRIEDQLQLVQLNLAGAQLERLWIYNCRHLAELSGLDMQAKLHDFRASRTALDLDALRDRDWPASMRSVHLFSGSQKWNDATVAILAARGLDEQSALWPY